MERDQSPEAGDGVRDSCNIYCLMVFKMPYVLTESFHLQWSHENVVLHSSVIISQPSPECSLHFSLPNPLTISLTHYTLRRLHNFSQVHASVLNALLPPPGPGTFQLILQDSFILSLLTNNFRPVSDAG